MKITKYTLDSGLRVIEDSIEGAKSFTLLVKFKTGSRNETLDIWGISHFLEHMAFKGTKSYPTALILAKELDMLGAMYNAFTGKEYTGYYLKGSYLVLEKALAIISEMTTDPIIDDAEVDKERGTIIEELNMYEDDPMRKIGDYFEEALYEDLFVSQEIIGSKASLKKIHAKELIAYREKYYRTGNAVVVISGKIPSNFRSMVEKHFQGLKSGENDYLSSLLEKKKHINILYKETQQTHLAIGFPGLSFPDKDREKALILSTILGGNMSSRMFSEVREKRGLAYYVRTISDSMLDNGYLATFAGVNNEKTIDAIKVINEVYQKVSTDLSDNELKRTKDHLKGILTLLYEDSEYRAEVNATAELYGVEHKTLDEKISKIENVTVDEVKAIAMRLIDEKKICLALIGPHKDEKKFEEALS